jgi:cyclopropane fatty-acyl-phospholipid synthase-like methyltransferase
MYQYCVIENGQLENMNDKALLETGCGRGGGLNYLAQVMHPRYAIGVDMSRSNVEFCKKNWPKGSHVHCEFLEADVEHLSTFVPRLSMDYVVDIESFFYYQDKHAYLREVHSVLKEEGRLFLAFFIQRTKLEEIHNWIRQYFDILKEDDITDNAIQAIRNDSQKLSRFADNNFPFGKRYYL